MTDHVLRSKVGTVHWGYFDAEVKPVLAIASGDRVTIETFSGTPDVMPPPSSPFKMLPELVEVHAQVPRKLPGHILTGPISIEGAMPGDVLQVDIEAIECARIGATTRSGRWPARCRSISTRCASCTFRWTAKRGVGTLSWGAEVPLKPFFGVMGVAPPPAWGMISSLPPRQHGGNLDNKELVAGTTLFLPVHVPAPTSRSATATARRATARSA